MRERDPGFDELVALDGVTFFVDAEGDFRVQFVVRTVEPSEASPHGLRYSLTLHGRKGERLVGFDNAHPVPKRSGPSRRNTLGRDHKHRFRTIRPYEYRDAATLLTDFWVEVDAVLEELGARP